MDFEVAEIHSAGFRQDAEAALWLKVSEADIKHPTVVDIHLGAILAHHQRRAGNHIPNVPDLAG